jgi:antitoxin VapB
MSVIAKVFNSGRSQALRLPARLRLAVKEVRIEKIGNDLWVHPETPPEEDMGQWLKNFYAYTEPFPDDFLTDRQDALPQERDWS